VYGAGSRIEAVCRRDRWILDGAYHGWRDVVLARADLVVGLDYPRRLSFWRLLRRTTRRLVTGEEICNGNRESLGSVLSRDSILVWHVTAFGRARRRMRACQARIRRAAGAAVPLPGSAGPLAGRPGPPMRT